MNYRYRVQILFKNSNSMFFARIWDINEPIKTLKEAISYKSLIDDSVESARIVDIVTNNVVEILK